MVELSPNTRNNIVLIVRIHTESAIAAGTPDSFTNDGNTLHEDLLERNQIDLVL